jgi:hypothetical protein
MLRFGIFIFLGILFVSQVNGQSCNLIRETDPYTRSVSLSTGYHKWAGGSILLDAQKAEIDWMIEVGAGNICFDDEATIQVFFEGTKQRMQFRNAGTINCEGLLHIYFKNTPATNFQLSKLATQPIQRVLITNAAKKEWSIEPNAEQRMLWMQAASCLVEESKKLLTQ